MAIEKKMYKDAFSGVPVTQLTDYKGHSHHFYFTNPGWYDNGRKLLFGSDRNNRTNLFGVEIATGEIEQLTDLEPVPLPRELCFLGACMNPVRDEVYFWHDLKMMALDLSSRKIRLLFEIESKWVVNMTNCSADGRYVYFGCFEDLSARIHTDMSRGYIGFAETWAAKPLSRIVRVPTDGSEGQVVREEQYFLGHVNTCPTQPHLLTFCHEGPWGKVDNRIWGLDVLSGKVWKIRPGSAQEYVGHEYWYADGLRIGYHGRRAEGTEFLLGHIRYDGQEQYETFFSGRPGHIFSHDEHLIVGDGGGVIRVWKWQDGRYPPPRVLCRHDSAQRIQQAHPHPRISPDGTYVVFSSDRSGYGNVYTVPMVEFESLPPAEN